MVVKNSKNIGLLSIVLLLAVILCEWGWGLSAQAAGSNYPIETIPYKNFDNKSIILFDNSKTKISVHDENLVEETQNGDKFLLLKENSTKTIKYWKDTNFSYWQKPGKIATLRIPFTVSDTLFYMKIELSDMLARKAKYEQDGCIGLASFGTDQKINLGVLLTNDNNHLFPKNKCKLKANTALSLNVSYEIQNSTGENITAKFPHDLIISDIDSGYDRNYGGLPPLPNAITKGLSNSVPEAAQLGEGFTKIYKPNTIKVSVKNNTIYNDYYGKDFGGIQGVDSFKYAGIWVKTDNKTKIKKLKIQHFWSGTLIQIATPLKSVGITKTLTSKNKATIGDTTTWRVKIPLPKKYEDSLSPYSELTVSDTLPTEYEIKKVTLIDDSTRTEKEGQKYVHTTSNSWEFTPTDKYLANKNNGGTLTFDIQAQIKTDAINSPNNKLTNCVSAIFSSEVAFDSCAKPVILVKPKPNIAVTKYGDGKIRSADTVKVAGSTVTFTYKVTNISKHESIVLADLKDSKIGNVLGSCKKKVLQPKESTLCVKNGKV